MMSNESRHIQELEDEESQLLKKLERIREEKKHLTDEKEAWELHAQWLYDQTKPIKAVKVRHSAGQVYVSFDDIRPDLLDILRDTPRRQYRADGTNSIPIEEWKRFRERVSALPDVHLPVPQKVEDSIEWYLNAPAWEVKIGKDRKKKVFRIRRGPGNNTYLAVPGSHVDHSTGEFIIPLSEGWRMFEHLKGKDVEYREEAHAELKKQIERRARLAEIIEDPDSVDLPDFPFYPPEGTELRPFQRAGIAFTDLAEGRAIIADQTGLGKTWEALAYAQMHELRTVVICKASLVPNWRRWIKRLTEEVPYVARGRDPTGYDIKKLVAEPSRYTIMNYNTLGSKVEVENGDGPNETKYRWATLVKYSKPDLLVFDESHYIKNPDAHRTKAALTLEGATPHILALTATPVENRPQEYWPTLHLIDSEMFPNAHDFETRYCTRGGMARRVKELREMLQPIMIRRLKKDVQKDLPPINRLWHYHDLSEKGRKLYQDALADTWTAIEEWNADGRPGGAVGIASVLAKITRMKQVCSMDKVEHTADLAREIRDSADNGGKVLLVSQFKAVAYQISRQLGSQAVCTVERTASGFKSLTAVERDRLFEATREDDSIEFVVTTFAAKEGHDLEYCEWVITNDLDWKPSTHEQIEGRAYGRLRNPHPIDAYYIITEESVETYLIALLEKKMAVIDEVVEGVESERDASVAMQLIEALEREMWKGEKGS